MFGVTACPRVLIVQDCLNSKEGDTVYYLPTLSHEVFGSWMLQEAYPNAAGCWWTVPATLLNLDAFGLQGRF